MKSEKVKYVTGKVYLLYPVLKEKKEWKGNLKYSVTMMFKKESPEATKLKEVLTHIWKENKLTKRDHNPLVDGDEYAEIKSQEGKNGDLYKGHYFIKASTQFDIKVVNGKKQSWTGEDQDISGNYGRVSFLLGAYDNDGKGITCYLQAVQILEKSDLEIQSQGASIDDFEYEEVPDDGEEEDLPF